MSLPSVLPFLSFLPFLLFSFSPSPFPSHLLSSSLPLRYIFTMCSPLARLIFPTPDDHQLTHLHEDNMRIEPEWYCPILPMVLVNGSDGIGTGYSTTVPNYDPREIVGNIKRIMNGLEPTEMVRCSDTKYVRYLP